MQTDATRARGAARPVDYPVRDGKPMGETDQHRDELAYYAVDVLRHHFREAPDVYVSGNNFVYWVEGDPRTVVSPDTYVVRGVPGHPREIFKVWEEGGHRPGFVLEITSKKTRREDTGRKLARYRDELRVPEYFLFDPRRDWVPEGLRGHTLGPDGVYHELAPDARGRLASAFLGLELAVVDGHVRFFLPGAAEPLPTAAERAERERARAEVAEGRAKAAEGRAEAAEGRAEVAEGRAQALEAELRRLRAALGDPPGEHTPPT